MPAWWCGGGFAPSPWNPTPDPSHGGLGSSVFLTEWSPGQKGFKTPGAHRQVRQDMVAGDNRRIEL